MKRKAFVYRIALAVVGLLLGVFSYAQDKVEMADTLRSNGKIYVVVAVCLTILVGLFIYVASIDRKISKAERQAR